MKPDYKTRGGKRPGSGRRPLDALGTVVITARITQEQYETWTKTGAAAWLRYRLDQERLIQEEPDSVLQNQK